MKYSSLHTHTTFCDGQDDIETYIRAAWEQGFHSIGFSTHAPVEKAGLCTGWHLKQARLEPCLDAVRAARRRWEGKIPVYLGLEIDWIQGRMGPADREYQALGLDYIIGAVHYVLPPDNAPPIAVDSSPAEFEQDLKTHFNGDGEALAAAYWAAQTEMIQAGGFDILAHFDLVKKNNPGDRWFSTASGAESPYLRAACALIDPIARSGAVVEINTGGLNRGSTTETYPSRYILSLLHEKTVPVIITADAHNVTHLGGHYDTARQTLQQAGYTKTVLFEGRRAGVPLWREDEL
ncbi:histidinol-phosphatase [Spirochaetia bacterium]|nr:histidinol-phosphatase [Spirochaetia bacterium]